MEIWYTFNCWTDEVEEQAVIKETASQLVIPDNGSPRRRERRIYKEGRSPVESYYPSREECLRAVIEHYRSQASSLMDRYNATQKRIASLETLTR